MLGFGLAGTAEWSQHVPVRCNADGHADNTRAVLDACERANATGGAVMLPRGRIRLRRGVPAFGGSGGVGERAVYILGAGWGSTEIVFDPEPGRLGDDVFTWGIGGEHYVGGGCAGFALRSLHAGASGRAINLRRTIFTQVQNVWVREFWLGKGLEIWDEAPQNIYLHNVQLQMNYIGLEATGVGGLVCTNMHLNQNQHRNLLFNRGGTFTWNGGLNQGVLNTGPGSISAELGVGNAMFPGNANQVTVTGVWCETHTETVWKVGAGVGTAANLSFVNNAWLGQGANRFIDADGARGIYVRGTDPRGNTTLVRARNRANGIVDGAPRLAKYYDLDSSCHFTLRQDNWEDPPEPVVGARWAVAA